MLSILSAPEFLHQCRYVKVKNVEIRVFQISFFLLPFITTIGLMVFSLCLCLLIVKEVVFKLG